MSDFGMLPKYKNASLEKLHKSASKDIGAILERLVSTSKKKFYSEKLNFFIYGKYRVGKTWVLHALMNKIRKTFNDNGVFYITSPQLTEYAIKNTWVAGFEPLTYIKHLSEVRVLMLDDLGQEYRGSKSGFAEFNLEKFLRYRFNNNLITYIGSNINPYVDGQGSSLSTLYGESLANLIDSEFMLYEIEGENMSELIMKERFND